MTVHNTDSHTRRGHRRVKPPKEEATFDTELQRYVMPGERHVTMPKCGKGLKTVSKPDVKTPEHPIKTPAGPLK